jgi:phage shock protein A
MEGQMESVHVEQKGLQSEFDELAQQEKIDQELAEMKSKLNNQE